MQLPGDYLAKEAVNLETAPHRDIEPGEFNSMDIHHMYAMALEAFCDLENAPPVIDCRRRDVGRHCRHIGLVESSHSVDVRV